MTHALTSHDDTSAPAPTGSTGSTESTETGPTSTEPVTLSRVVRSEWIKFRSLRSSWAVLGAAVLVMLVFGIIVGFNTRHLTAGQDPDDLGKSATLQGYYLGQLLIGALGVLFVTGEFSTGMIRSTFAAVPTRLPVLVAKFLVFFVVSAAAMVVVSVVAFLAGQAVISQDRPGYSLSDPGALRVVLGVGVYLALVGLLGGAIGWIVRSTPGSLVAYFAVMLVLPVVFNVVLGQWGKNVYKFLPSGAGSSFFSSPQEPDSLQPWAGLGVLVIWITVALTVAALSLRRRDA